jgi:hypothetical protein
MITHNVREHHGEAFTLIELLVALTVSSFILTVVLTLALAMTTAMDSGDDTADKQAQVRYATLRISELIRQCKLVCGTPGSDLAIWKSDDDGDGRIDITELVYIETGNNRDYIRLLDFPKKPNWLNFPLPPIYTQIPWFKEVLKYYCQEQYIVLIEQCSNVQFLLDIAPPETEFVSISFALEENGVSHQYQICASLRTRAGHLLDSIGHIVSDDD